MRLFEVAFEKGGATPEALTQLVDLKFRIDKRNAELEFATALRDFQRACPAIPRSSSAKIPTKSGGSFEFKFADLEQIIETVRPHLYQLGLSFTFDSKTDGKMLTCTCTLRHVNGHAVQSSFTLPTDSSSAMSEQQRYGAALTFAKRQSLTAVLGLSLTDPVAPGEEADPSPVTDSQAADLMALAEDVKADVKKFLGWAGVERFEDIPARRYQEMVRALERKRRKS